MPKIQARDTKESIMSAALKLFSERGYEGVGIRDIAHEVGIRESAVYKHYRGKQDIFDSILTSVGHRYRAEVGAMAQGDGMSGLFPDGRDPRGELFGTVMTMFRFYLSSEYGSQLRRMLTMEQYRSSHAGSFFRELIIDKGLEEISQAFGKLIDQGIYIDGDPVVMALQFYSPVYLLLSRYDNRPESHEEAVDLLRRHIVLFDASYAKDGGR